MDTLLCKRYYFSPFICKGKGCNLTDQQQQTFPQYALLTGILASIACGIIGSYVVARRITYIAGGIAHSVLAGMGAARYCETVYERSWLHPLYGAVAAALIAAIIIGFVSLSAKQREDTVIGAVWAVGMAVGILFIFKTPGYVVLLVTVVGIVMVIALITLPAAAASQFSKRLWHMMAISVGFAIFFTTACLAFSYGPDLPAGATTIVLAGAVYLAVVIVPRFIKVRRL